MTLTVAQAMPRNHGNRSRSNAAAAFSIAARLFRRFGLKPAFDTRP
jgi:hypothetical protein